MIYVIRVSVHEVVFSWTQVSKPIVKILIKLIVKIIIFTFASSTKKESGICIIAIIFAKLLLYEKSTY